MARRNVKHLVALDRQLKFAKASIKKFCNDSRNALLAMSVKQVHATKRTINKLAFLREQPLHFIADKNLFEEELEKACTTYYNTFRELWIDVDSAVVDNSIFHYVYDESDKCAIREQFSVSFGQAELSKEWSANLHNSLCNRRIN